jgi:two-component system sensor histidine kinase KdpD
VLLASVSHDLRTPLTAMKIAVSGLLDAGETVEPADLREILQEIDLEVDFMSGLVNDMVDLSRIEMGALKLDKEWCDLAELVNNAYMRMSRRLSGREAHIDVSLPMPSVLVDYAQIGRVVEHLLENADRHSREGDVIHIDVDVFPMLDRSASVQVVRVQVSDRGSGVPPTERERIFQSFYSLDVQGHGLGLAICRGIVEAHSGKIWVEDNPGGGARFIFVLPINE